MNRRFGLGAIAVVGLGLLVWFLGLLTAGPPQGATATDLLGIVLPASAREEQLAIERHGLGEFRVYIRFAIDPADVPALLTDPAFQQQRQADQPLAVFSNASIGGRSLAAEVLQARPRGGDPRTAHASP